jgi:hypothetical protein
MEDAMALQLGALRDALIDAGAAPEKADKAAEELAGYETRLNGIDLKLIELGSSVRLVQAMLGVNVALTAGVLCRLLAHT